MLVAADRPPSTFLPRPFLALAPFDFGADGGGGEVGEVGGGFGFLAAGSVGSACPGGVESV